MEDSRKGKKGKKKKKGFKRLIHTWMEKNGEKAIVYNTEEGKGKGGRKKEKTGRIVYFQVRTLEHFRGYFLDLYRSITLSF